MSYWKSPDVDDMNRAYRAQALEREGLDLDEFLRRMAEVEQTEDLKHPAVQAAYSWPPMNPQPDEADLPF